MGWQEKMKEWGGAEVSFLSEDGEVAIFIILGEPILLTGKFKGKVSERIGCPIFGQDGFSLFIIGKRLARRIARYEKDFKTKAFMIVREGEHGDIDTSYKLSIFDDKEVTEKLFADAKREFKPEMIQEAVDAAQDIVKG